MGPPAARATGLPVAVCGFRVSGSHRVALRHWLYLMEQAYNPFVALLQQNLTVGGFQARKTTPLGLAMASEAWRILPRPCLRPSPIRRPVSATGSAARSASWRAGSPALF